MGKRNRRRARDVEALRARNFRPLLAPKHQRELDEIVARIAAEGYRVEYVEWCEDARFPGFLGQTAGRTVPAEKLVMIRTPGMSPDQIVAIASHELEHVLGAEWATDHEHLGMRCGGRVNGWGELVKGHSSCVTT